MSKADEFQMNQKLEERLTLFLENSQSMRKDFVWQDSLTKRLAALIYACENKPIDNNAIRACHDLIKKSTGAFSSFRGNLAICIATLLSLSNDRDRQLADTLAVYEMMKASKFRASDYLTIAAYQIAANTDHLNYDRVVARTKAFYDGMKQNHRFHTGKDDYIFAAMLGLSDIDVETGVDRMEQLHRQLKHYFSNGNSIQVLTQVLVLGGEPDSVITRLIRLKESMLERKIRMDREYTLSSLGILALLPSSVEASVNDISASYEFLRTQKGFGALSITKQELLLFSAAIVSSTHIDGVESDILTSNLSTNIMNIIIAQQAAIAAVVATSAATSASSSSSS